MYLIKFVLRSIIKKKNNGENTFFEGGINIWGIREFVKG